MPSPTSVIAAGNTVEGNVSADETLVIHGQLRGVVVSSADVIVEEGAVVEADVHAACVEVRGTIKETNASRPRPDRATRLVLYDFDGDAVTEAAGLTLVIDRPLADTVGGRQGEHTEHLEPLLDEMCEVYRIEPRAAW